MKKKFTEISMEEAKSIYCKSGKIYITTSGTKVWEGREYWKLPASYEYGSHAPAEELFYKSIPEHEGEVRFFKA